MDMTASAVRSGRDFWFTFSIFRTESGTPGSVRESIPAICTSPLPGFREVKQVQSDFPAHPAAHFPGQDVHENFSGGADHSPHQMAAVAFSLDRVSYHPMEVQVWFPVLSRYAACQGCDFISPLRHFP